MTIVDRCYCDDTGPIMLLERLLHVGKLRDNIQIKWVKTGEEEIMRL
jgi:hypothetical protein